MPDMKQNYKQAILVFLLTFVVMISLLMIEFFIHYHRDLFGKNLATSDIFKVTFLGMLSVLEFAFPISLLVMTLVHYRNISKQGFSEIKLKSTLLISSVFAVIFFIWIAFLLPVVDLHLAGFLYDIRSKEINKPIERSSLTLFKDSPSTSSYFQLNDLMDSTYSHSLVEIKNISKYVEANRISGNELKAYQEDINHKTEQANYEMNKLRIKKSHMLTFPIMIFILFYSGMFLGVLNKNNRLSLILFSTYCTVLPGIYFLSRYFENLAKESTLTPFQGQLYFILIILSITLALYFYAKSHLKKGEILLVDKDTSTND